VTRNDHSAGGAGGGGGGGAGPGGGGAGPGPVPAVLILLLLDLPFFLVFLHLKSNLNQGEPFFPFLLFFFLRLLLVDLDPLTLLFEARYCLALNV